MYKILSEVSLLLRMYLCYLTIDNIPILKNDLQNYILLEVISLYTILIIVTYFEVGTFYKKGEDSEFGVVAYFFVYLINLGVMYAIMLVLTKIGVLPIQEVKNGY